MILYACNACIFVKRSNSLMYRFNGGRVDPMLQLLGYMVKKRTSYGLLTDGVIFCFVRLRRVTSNPGQLPDSGTAQCPFPNVAQPPSPSPAPFLAPNVAQAKPGENKKVEFNAKLHFGCYTDTKPTVVEQLLTWLDMATTGDDAASWPHFPELNPKGADTGCDPWPLMNTMQASIFISCIAIRAGAELRGRLACSSTSKVRAPSNNGRNSAVTGTIE